MTPDNDTSGLPILKDDTYHALKEKMDQNEFNWLLYMDDVRATIIEENPLLAHLIEGEIQRAPELAMAIHSQGIDLEHAIKVACGICITSTLTAVGHQAKGNVIAASLTSKEDTELE